MHSSTNVHLQDRWHADMSREESNWRNELIAKENAYLEAIENIRKIDNRELAAWQQKRSQLLRDIQNTENAINTHEQDAARKYRELSSEISSRESKMASIDRDAKDALRSFEIAGKNYSRAASNRTDAEKEYNRTKDWINAPKMEFSVSPEDYEELKEKVRRYESELAELKDKLESAEREEWGYEQSYESAKNYLDVKIDLKQQAIRYSRLPKVRSELAIHISFTKQESIRLTEELSAYRSKIEVGLNNAEQTHQARINQMHAKKEQSDRELANTKNSRITLLLDRANASSSAGFGDRAVADAKRAVNLESSAHTVTFLANAYLINKEYSLSENSYNQAITLNDKWWPAYTGLGMIYELREDYLRSRNNYKYSLGINPSDKVTVIKLNKINSIISEIVELKFKQAEAKSTEGRDNLAIIAYSEIIQYEPNNHVAFYLRGTCFSRIGQLDSAAADFDSTLRHHKNYWQAYYARAELYKAKGNINSAISDYKNVVQLNNNHEDASYKLAILLYSKREFSNAAKYFSNAIRCNPNHPSAYLNRGDSYYCAGDFSSAIPDYKKYLEQYPQNLQGHFQLGLAFYCAHKNEDANASFNNVITLAPNHGDAWHHAGLARSNLKDDLGAIHAYTRAIECNSTYIAEAYYKRAIIRNNHTDSKIPMADYAEAIRRGYTDKGNAHYYKGVLHFNLKEYQECINEQLSAIKINPQHILAYRQCGLVYEQSDRNDIAYQWYNKALGISPESKEIFPYLNRVRDSIFNAGYISAENKTNTETLILKAIFEEWQYNKVTERHQDDVLGYISAFRSWKEVANRALEIRENGKLCFKAPAVSFFSAIDQAQKSIYSHLLNKKKFRKDNHLTRLNSTINTASDNGRLDRKPWLQSELPTLKFFDKLVSNTDGWIKELEKTANQAAPFLTSSFQRSKQVYR